MPLKEPEWRSKDQTHEAIGEFSPEDGRRATPEGGPHTVEGGRRREGIGMVKRGSGGQQLAVERRN